MNLWSSGCSHPRHNQCFIYINFIFFSYPVDTLLLHPHFVNCSLHFHFIIISALGRGLWNNAMVILSAIFIFPLLPSSPHHLFHLIVIIYPSFPRVHMGPCIPYFINTILISLLITAAAQILCCHILLILLVQWEMVPKSCNIMWHRYLGNCWMFLWYQSLFWQWWF